MFKKCTTILILTLFPFIVSADITTGLKAYWSLDDGSGNIVTDTSGNMNHGVSVSGDLIWDTLGKFKSALYFDGANTSGRGFSQEGFTGTTTRTYSLWIKHDSERGDSAQPQFLIGQEVGGSNPCVSLALTNGTTARLYFFGQAGGSIVIPASTWEAVEASSVWTHVVAVNNPEADESRLYIDGIEVGSSTAISCTQPWGNRIVVGEEVYHGFEMDYNGLLDDIRVYDRALTDDDVAELYAWEPTDTTPPVITITSPESATTTLTRYITLGADVSDDVGVQDVRFYIDGEAVGELDVEAPYTFNFDTTTVANGVHELTVVARDTTLNTTTSNAITFTVQNPTGPDYYVTPDGTSTGNGSTHDPWDIETAFENIEALEPGSIIWILEGAYEPSTPYGFSIPVSGGTASSPIIVRNYDNARVILDGALAVNADNVWIWGLEITTLSDFPSLEETRDEQNEGYADGTYPRTNLSTGGDNIKIINNIMHNNPQSHGSSVGGTNIEYYGNLFLNTGRNSSTYPSGHGAYIQNDIGYKRFINNIIGNGFLNGFNLYSGGVAPLNNIFLQNNILFGHRAQGNVLVGSDAPAEGFVMIDNVLHNNGTYNYHNMSTGYGGSLVPGLILKSNMFVGGGPYLKGLADGYTVTWNKMFKSILVAGFTGDLEGGVWGYNTYEATTQNPFTVGIYPADTNVPFETWVEQGRLESEDFEIGTTFSQTHDTRIAIRVYPNMFESGRGHIAIMNLDEDASIDVDVSTILVAGDSYRIRPVQNYYEWNEMSGEYDYGSSTTGVYNGSSIAFPMTGWELSVPKTANEGEFITTFPEFGVFTIERTALGTVDTTEPELSGGVPSGYIGTGYATTTLSVTTSEYALCKYSTTEDTPFNFMLGLFDDTGTTTHTILLEDIEDDTVYTYYVRCRDRSDNVTTDDYRILFTTGDEPPEEEPEGDDDDDDANEEEDSSSVSRGGTSSSHRPTVTPEQVLVFQQDTTSVEIYNQPAGAQSGESQQQEKDLIEPLRDNDSIDMRIDDIVEPEKPVYLDSSFGGFSKMVVGGLSVFAGLGALWFVFRRFIPR